MCEYWLGLDGNWWIKRDGKFQKVEVENSWQVGEPTFVKVDTGEPREGETDAAEA